MLHRFYNARPVHKGKSKGKKTITGYKVLGASHILSFCDAPFRRVEWRNSAFYARRMVCYLQLLEALAPEAQAVVSKAYFTHIILDAEDLLSYEHHF